ncbi:putative retroelement [Phytophthora cinnamomi]|uniref:putative retroelement n=1 Tax=Phytophthora cinnamomi TaxID=4785 RepID=UPI0035599BEA|nr:putative retroelement [Phytophthora cinnamomi]
MGRGKVLSKEEHWWVVGLADAGLSLHEIERRTGRARTSLKRVVAEERGPQSDTDTGKAGKAGRQASLSERETRLLVRAAATGAHTAAELKSKYGCKASLRTVQRLLHDVDFLVYTKMDQTLPLTAAHKQARMLLAETHILTLGKYPF